MKNTKADALSRLHVPDEQPRNPETIIPTELIVSPIQWTLDDDIAAASVSDPALPGCPPGHICSLQSMNTTHSFSAHLPGHWSSRDQSNPLAIERLLLVAQNGEWYQKVCERMLGMCYGQNNSLLTHWQTPTSPCTLDFITDLPTSDNNTCILVSVDKFSKACRLAPLKGLPTAMETAEVLFNHVFRNFGIPEDIVSDRGPQFISRVWRAFCSLLGVTISLSSGYHPQSNRQTERKIQEIGRYLRTFCHGHHNSWNRFLARAEHAQNSIRQPSVVQCVLGYQPPLFPWSGELSEVPSVTHWFQESERV